MSFVKSMILTLAVAGTANAGEVLKLNVGNVRPAQVQEKFAKMYSGAQKMEWIVQFKSAVRESDKAALRQAGAEVFNYLPDDAMVVRADGKTVMAFQQTHTNINAVIPYAGSYKVSSEFGPTSIFNRDVNSAIYVQTFKASETQAIAQKIQSLGSEVLVQSVGGKAITVSMPRQFIPVVAAFTGVEHLQPVPEIESFHFKVDAEDSAVVIQGTGDYTDLNGSESGTKVMHMESAWAQNLTGRNQIASMGDTGLDSGDVNTIHQDFRGAVKTGYFLGMFAKSWIDPMGHGTHVAGSIVGRGTASAGLLRGAAYDAQFVPVGLWSPMLGGLSLPTKLADLFSKPYGDGARVHSNSWGQAKNFGAYDGFAQQVDEFMFNNPDMLVLFAAGNSGVDMNKDGRIDANSIGSPGTAKNCLTVGASENKTSSGGIQVQVSKMRAAPTNWSAEPIFSSYLSDNENGLAMFSSRGPTADGRIKPEIVAPGTNILSVRDQTPKADPLWGIYNNDYVWAGGTSMATPLTAGAVTVARQMLQERYKIANPSAALMKAVMIHNADDLFPGQYGERAQGQELLTRRPNSDEGYGRVNMANVVGMNADTQLVDSTAGVAQGAQVVYDINLTKPSTILANLVWTDAPASANAAQALVNDLDMSLVTPAGQTISMNDHVNNNEIIEQGNLPAGAYKLVIKGNRVPQGKNGAQPFALVYSVK